MEKEAFLKLMRPTEMACREMTPKCLSGQVAGDSPEGIAGTWGRRQKGLGFYCFRVFPHTSVFESPANVTCSGCKSCGKRKPQPIQNVSWSKCSM